jgi:hypothetical protein
LAVTDFENLSGFSGQWNLGGGMADLLVTALMDSRKAIVLERQHIGDVIGELVRQGQGLFRPEGRAPKGRLKNARFLVRGVITDFTVTGDASAGTPRRARLACGARRLAWPSMSRCTKWRAARWVCSVKTDGTASARRRRARVNYKHIAFGGDVFFSHSPRQRDGGAIADAVQPDPARPASNTGRR